MNLLIAIGKEVKGIPASRGVLIMMEDLLKGAEMNKFVVIKRTDIHMP